VGTGHYAYSHFMHMHATSVVFIQHNTSVVLVCRWNIWTNVFGW